MHISHTLFERTKSSVHIDDLNSQSSESSIYADAVGSVRSRVSLPYSITSHSITKFERPPCPITLKNTLLHNKKIPISCGLSSQWIMGDWLPGFMPIRVCGLKCNPKNKHTL